MRTKAQVFIQTAFLGDLVLSTKLIESLRKKSLSVLCSCVQGRVRKFIFRIKPRRRGY
jgi:hypothetical protein